MRYAGLPAEEEQQWVGCDKCNKWFHVQCAGLQNHDNLEDEDFICADCMTQGDNVIVAPNMNQSITPTAGQQSI